MSPIKIKRPIFPAADEDVKQKLRDIRENVHSWDEFHNLISEMRDTAWIFRGVSSPTHYPIPSIGRDTKIPYFRDEEVRLFRDFKKRAVALLTDPRLTDWDWLAYAQHIGVPTRLLDWTTSPLIAAFFALEKDNDLDRLIYCVKYSTYIYEVDIVDSPFDNDKEGRFSPPLLFDRIRAQRGVFTIHPRPTKVFYRDGMRVIRIPNSNVDEFRRVLFKYGIDYWYIYPDAEGLGRQLSWQFHNKIGLGLRSSPAPD